MLDFRIRMQIAEALGPVNRWYCSMYYDRVIDDPELLIRYFVKSGGAASFALRFDEAMSPLNRWFCSEHHRREIRDPQVLWDYYMNYAGADPKPSDLRNRVSA
jgi:hypothetical protein